MANLRDIRIKAGYDEALIDLDNIEDLTPTGGSPQTRHISGYGDFYFFIDETPYPDYSRGEQRIDAEGGVAFAGFEQVRYVQSHMHVDSYAWLKTNYEGQVTAYIRTSGTGYTRYNCQLRFEDDDSTQGGAWRRVTWIFTVIEASS